MGFLDIFKTKELKKEIEDYKNKINELENENQNLKNIKYNLDQLKYKDLKLEISKLLEEKEKTLNDFNSEKFKREVEIQEKSEAISKLNDNIASLNNDIIVLEEEKLMQSFGFYNPKYNLENSELYKNKLDKIRAEQKQMVKNKTAVSFIEWTVNDSKAEGKKMTNDMIKLSLRSFNLECDNVILKVKFNNIQTCEKRLNSAFNTMNKLGRVTKVTISHTYLKLKFEELYLAYEYERKKQEEKEEQRALKERMREEAKVIKEIEAMKEKIAKEEKHFSQALAKFKSQLENCTPDKKEKLEEKIKELEDKLALLEKDKEDVLNREQNTRAGYVYIISNVGSFGESVYKIGMTRRLEPMDRISELSSASVPFAFDVHAMIFSDDAPALENELHKEFETKRVNKINSRKEFFKVSLSEIEQIVKIKHNKIVQFTKLAQAEEYRQTLKLEQSEKVESA
ncbi:DUF4041 domain-containing protein [Clostridium botulinum]|uniref:DUF4041 domain-containing protein n=1 Tax=Clostridium botulinum TaxID=1491 RepID=UPI0006AC7713|nr:DUF4041 domain-containing protein [Clostridium botulinum]KOR54817.1 ATPase [Clostridium botulinum]MBD5587692.1 DUF4041 domain-containing protein [Clostridium botulinum]MBY6839530.1 DUF4041 domain-containing protein [Clostridium botulinum]MCR1166824.1 DUF4041 domain-containing protein [Clostridium botulinum]NFM78194.1 DUF4041 domain-containing protein [Clostridium botulinum]